MELQDFGLTLKDMEHSLRHAAVITAIGIVILFFLGYLIGFKAFSLDSSWLLFYVIISVPLQELLFRGIVQTKLYRFGRPGAILIATAL